MSKISDEKYIVVVTGIAIGVASVVLASLGNPDNMGFCIACFIRDISGSLKLHTSSMVQYYRPEIVGIVLGALLASSIHKELRPRGGSSPILRFLLGMVVMIGALVFLGCPLRMVIRMGGGDLNAFVGLIGFIIGTIIGITFLRKGFTLKRNYALSKGEGLGLPLALAFLLVLFVTIPTLFAVSETGPGSKHAPILFSLLIAMVVGYLCQRSRFCMVGGMRDLILFKDFHLIIGFITCFIVILLANIITGHFSGFSTYLQPISHESQLWNVLGMVLVGWGSVLLGGCPLRQLILTGEGCSDSAVTILGMILGAAFSHNFGLAGSASSLKDDDIYYCGGISINGKIAVFICLIILLVISCSNLQKKVKKDA